MIMMKQIRHFILLFSTFNLICAGHPEFKFSFGNSGVKCSLPIVQSK